MKHDRYCAGFISMLIVVVSQFVVGTSSASPALDMVVQREAEAAVVRGMAWLEAQQGGDGRFGSNAPPAATALALAALKAGGASNRTVLRNAERYVREIAGGTASGGLEAMNRQVCRSILGMEGFNGSSSKVAVRRDLDLWKKADWAAEREAGARSRDFELRQIMWRKTSVALAAQGKDPNRAQAEAFARAAVGAPPVATNLLVTPPPQPKVRRGYGNLTYSGLLRLVQDDVSSDDPRVDSMLNWAEHHWSLDENPGKGQAGLYFFYNALSKCLAASGEEDILPLDGKPPIRWRDDIARKLVALQRQTENGKSGYWVNENHAYFENDPVLATAYALLSLERTLARTEDIRRTVVITRLDKVQDSGRQ